MMKKVFFCHGMPGSQSDVELLQKANPSTDISAIDLLGYTPQTVGQAFIDAFNSEEITTDRYEITLVGFSIGVMAAIKIAVAYPNMVSRLILISPAAPLSLGNFLPEMAGKPVFELAMKRPKMLRVLTTFQALMTRVSPNTIMNILFRECGPTEKALLNDSDFRTAIINGLKQSFVREPTTYLAYIKDYVTDWSAQLDLVQCPVDLWHGTNDTWSPPQMSSALRERFGDMATLNLVEEAEHYSTMAQVRL